MSFMQEFSRFPDLTEYTLIFYGGPLALIITRKNHIKLRKIQRMRDFFINEFGIFEVDSEAQYRFGKQPISLYNSHGTLIPKKIAKRVNRLYQKGKFFELKNELLKIYPELKQIKFDTIYEMFEFIVKNTQHRSIDIDTEKYLPYFRAYNPISIKRLNEACQTARKSVDNLNPSLKPPMPIMIAVIVGILALAFIQNGPKYMRELVGYFEELGEAVDPTPPIVEELPIVANQTIVNLILGLQSLF